MELQRSASLYHWWDSFALLKDDSAPWGTVQLLALTKSWSPSEEVMTSRWGTKLVGPWRVKGKTGLLAALVPPVSPTPWSVPGATLWSTVNMKLYSGITSVLQLRKYENRPWSFLCGPLPHRGGRRLSVSEPPLDRCHPCSAPLTFRAQLKPHGSCKPNPLLYALPSRLGFSITALCLNIRPWLISHYSFYRPQTRAAWPTASEADHRLPFKAAPLWLLRVGFGTSCPPCVSQSWESRSRKENSLARG